MGIRSRSPRHLAQTGHELTSTETDIVRLLARGLQRKEISAELNMSLSTVKTHLESTYRKLGVHNQAGAVAWLLSDTDGGEGPLAE